MTTAAMMPSPSATPPPPLADLPAAASALQNPDLSTLSSSNQSRPGALSRPTSYLSKGRLSQYSAGSIPSRSRPQSHAFPMFPSSLSYTQVRDFAYSIMSPLHYGPPPESSLSQSGLATPASEQRRLSDPPTLWDQKMPWDSWSSDGFNKNHDLPPIQFGDGPPYSEDDDLQSPVVSTRHRKHKSTSSALGVGRGRAGREGDILNPANYDDERGYFIRTGGDGSEQYYISQGGEANGPGGELITYPPDQARHDGAQQYPRGMDDYEGYRSGSGDSIRSSSPGYRERAQSRYSRDYQFTITSPDEEFHGKAVALFDFERENENELPLVEGQIIWVSYRHGQGWLVAEDPKTQESGLVPEAYVRLLRDIEGGMNSLAGLMGDGTGSPDDVESPTQQEHNGQYGHTPTQSTSTNGYHQPVVSTFSTSSKDLNPYPTEQLGLQAGQAPPQVVHYHGQRGGSQISTPTIAQLQESTGTNEGDEKTKVEQSEPAEGLPKTQLEPEAEVLNPDR